MTNEEAIKWCRDFQDNIVDVTDKLEDKHTMALKAVNKAIEALAKQMPQKPIEEQGLMTCPVCGCQDIESIDASGIRQYPHCPCCSQAIDWSDSNEQ